MSLATLDPQPSPSATAQALLRCDPPGPSPPPVIITRSDPWPRPYYLENGLRRVAPYHFTYNTYCKQRWRGRTIIDIFASEFRDRPEEYYRDAMETGLVVLNGKKLDSVHTIVRNGDLIQHTMHRHEPPVSAEPIGIVHEDDDLLVINKPAGIPVHPTGRYNYNSVVEILRSERNYGWNPMPCNRLDRLTSGIMFIGKHRDAADKMSRQIMDRNVKKEYIARVKGEFPEGTVECNQPLLQISPKLGLNRVRARGKEAKTIFKRLAYYPPLHEEENERVDRSEEMGLPWRKQKGWSIVRCLPLTGRTHQLRVHLQFLGHPISNDPIYCNQKVFGQKLGYGSDGSDNDENVIARLSKMGKTEVADAVAYHDEMVTEYNKRKGEKITGQTCEICDTELYSDPGIHELGIYLHARKYACAEGKWSYETPLPTWALPPLGMDGPTEIVEDTDPLATDLANLQLENEKKDDGDETFTLFAPYQAGAPIGKAE